VLSKIKSDFIERERQRALMREYPIEDDIQNIISILGTVIIDENKQQELSLDPEERGFEVQFRHTGTDPPQDQADVSDYYPYVLREFRVLEQVYPTKSELIYAQIRSFYLKQKNLVCQRMRSTRTWWSGSGGRRSRERLELPR
jgi:hypothetical protein